VYIDNHVGVSAVYVNHCIGPTLQWPTGLQIFVLILLITR